VSRTTHEEIGKAVDHGVEAGGFFSAILAGFLLGFLADRWLDTEPLWTVMGIVAGSGTGFWKMWRWAKGQE
jgi:F0F1-type ATP synthase assembly protein I